MNTIIEHYQWLIDALGWTLLHFLWQGALIEGLLFAVMAVLRRGSANARYLAGCVALVLLAAAPVATFYREVAPTSLGNKVDQTETPQISVSQNATPSDVNRNAISAVALRERAGAVSRWRVAERVFPWVVATWLVGVLVLTLRLLAGWLAVQRLKRLCVTAIDHIWTEHVNRLRLRLKISRPVQLLRSTLVEVPTVIGWIRPAILLPVSTLCNLTPQQLESILAHELAHICRHDYLVNLMQTLIETVLFYHPAVWWVSKQVREERENCCDDLAVEVCGDRLNYLNALANLEALRASPQLTLAANSGSLLKRVRRLLLIPDQQPRGTVWWLAGLILLVGASLSYWNIRAEGRLSTQTHSVDSLVQEAWKMAYVPVVKDPAGRWNSVQQGIGLLRDEGLQRYPDNPKVYLELCWLYQNKLGKDLDDAHMFYKMSWANEMNGLFGGNANIPELVNPVGAEAIARVKVLRKKYKMDPQIMAEVDKLYGSLEWRLPDAHAIYWAEVGRRKAKAKDQKTLRLSIGQSMQQAFFAGGLTPTKTSTNGSFIIGPNLELAPKVSAAYEQLMGEDPSLRDKMQRAHCNFLKDTVYLFYINSRPTGAKYWFDYIKKNYPDSLKKDLTLDEFVSQKLTLKTTKADKPR